MLKDELRDSLLASRKAKQNLINNKISEEIAAQPSVQVITQNLIALVEQNFLAMKGREPQKNLPVNALISSVKPGEYYEHIQTIHYNQLTYRKWSIGDPSQAYISAPMDDMHEIIKSVVDHFQSNGFMVGTNNNGFDKNPKSIYRRFDDRKSAVIKVVFVLFL